MSFYFGDKTWVELEDYIKKDAIVILPIGTTEEHGHHLPVECDAIIARYYGDRLGEAAQAAGIPVLVMQTINFGFSMKIIRKWPGCPNIEPDNFTAYIFDICDSLIHMGFTKIVKLDCHGNHDCLLRTVMRKIADKHNIFTMTLSPSKLSDKKYNEIKKDPEGDIHGGEWETSAILHIRPDLVKTDKYTNVDAIRCNSILRGPVSTWGLQDTKTGLFGDPTHATAELGKAVMDAATEEGVKYLKAFYEHKEKSTL